MKVDVNILDITTTTTTTPSTHIHTHTMTVLMVYSHILIWLHIKWEKVVKGKISFQVSNRTNKTGIIF